MKNTFFKIKHWLNMLLKWITSVFKLVVLYPLETYITSKCRLTGWKLNILLFPIKLFRGILSAFIIFTIIKGYYDYDRKYQFADNEIIEAITRVPFPNVKIIDYKKGETSFRGEYLDVLTLEMKEGLSETVYCCLDSIIDNRDEDDMGGWTMCDDEYRFSAIWGGLIPAPDGGYGGDMSFSLSIKKGSKIATLEYGAF